MSALEKRAGFAGSVMKASYLLCLLVLTLSTWVWVQEGRQPSLTIYLIRILPLAIFAGAVFKVSLRGLAWLCFVCLGYFISAVTESMSPLAIWINYLELALIVILFCSAMIYIRWQSQAWKAKAAALEGQLTTEGEH
jgi:uncharacterized membrane protein